MLQCLNISIECRTKLIIIIIIIKKQNKQNKFHVKICLIYYIAQICNSAIVLLLDNSSVWNFGKIVYFCVD